MEDIIIMLAAIGLSCSWTALCIHRAGRVYGTTEEEFVRSIARWQRQNKNRRKPIAPRLMQTGALVRMPRDRKPNGHRCGHILPGASSMVSRWQ